VGATQERGKLGVVSGMLLCAFRKEAIRQWAGLGRDRSLCGDDVPGVYPASLTRFCADLVSL
jgi:hypothetical protein